MTNYRVYQTAPARISVWEIESAAEIAEAHRVLTSDGEHTYQIRPNIFSDARHFDHRRAVLWGEVDPVVRAEVNGSEIVVVGLNYKLVRSTNGTAYISRDGYEDGEDWPDCLFKPELHLLPG